MSNGGSIEGKVSGVLKDVTELNSFVKMKARYIVVILRDLQSEVSAICPQMQHAFPDTTLLHNMSSDGAVDALAFLDGALHKDSVQQDQMWVQVVQKLRLTKQAMSLQDLITLLDAMLPEDVAKGRSRLHEHQAVAVSTTEVKKEVKVEGVKGISELNEFPLTSMCPFLVVCSP